MDDHCFDPAAHPSIREYIEKIRQDSDLEEAIVRFDREVARYLQEQKYLNGFVSEEVLDTGVRMKFLTSNMYHFGRWLLTLQTGCRSSLRPTLRTTMKELAEKISAHYVSY